jgi:thiol-disulfide isomerase/thioredoxin
MKNIIFIFTVLLILAAVNPLYSLGKSETVETPVEAETREAQPVEDSATQIEEEPQENPSPLSQDLQNKLRNVGVQAFDEEVMSVDFTLKNLAGEDISLSSYRGKVIFLNFWATWCGPCRAEMPSMQKMYEALKGEDFEIIAVNLQENEDVVKQFIEESGYTYPILLDTTGRIGGTYGARSIPTTYIIDKNGFVLGGLIGSREWDDEETIDVFRQLAQNG